MSDAAVVAPPDGAAPSGPFGGLPDVPGSAPATAPSGPRPLSRWWSLLLTFACGVALFFAFPGWNLWPLAPFSYAGLILATRGQRTRWSALLGLVYGLAFFVPHLHWSGIYVGLVPWFGLAGANAVYMLVFGALLPRIWSVPGRAAGTIVAGTGLWVAQEAGRSRWPFGGFPWGRLAFSQSEAPTLRLAALGGAPLVSAAVAAAGVLLAYALHQIVLHQVVLRRGAAMPADGGHLRHAGIAVLAAGLVTVAGFAVPLPTNGKRIQVAAVQGNVPRAGLGFNAQRRAVLNDHVAGTLKLANDVKAGTAKQPDLVLWPENSSDIDPLENPDAAAVIDQAVSAVKVPLLVGAVVDGPGRYLSNESIVWRPGSGPGTGPDSVYVKRHPAPFAEYIPYRSFFRHFSDKVDLVTRDFVSGNKLRANPVGVLSMGPARVGDVICFEVAYDGLVRDPVKQGADILAVQTNNATFGHSAESVQQLAMSRLRAIETGRTVVHISTVGVSAIILPNGTVEQRTSLFQQQILDASVPLRTQLTIATRVGEWPEWILTALGLGLVLAGAVAGRTRDRRGRAVSLLGTQGTTTGTTARQEA
jgi:apolipoprotein N-acyltransferase